MLRLIRTPCQRDPLIVLHEVRAMAEVTQAGMSQAALEALGIIWPPTEDELPSDDGMPMETPRLATAIADRSPAPVLGRPSGRLCRRQHVHLFQPGTSAQSGLPRTGFFCGARRAQTRAQELARLGRGQRARRCDRVVI